MNGPYRVRGKHDGPLSGVWWTRAVPEDGDILYIWRSEEHVRSSPVCVGTVPADWLELDPDPLPPRLVAIPDPDDDDAIGRLVEGYQLAGTSARDVARGVIHQLRTGTWRTEQ